MNRAFFGKKRNVVITAILYTFMWGCAFPLVKLCLKNFMIDDADNISKCMLAGIRFFLSGILTLSCCRFLGERPPLKLSHLKFVTIYGILATFMQYAFTYIGLSRVDGSKGAVFDQACVFIIIIFSGIFFKNDKLNFKKITGCVLGFIGVAVINIDKINFDFKLNGEGLLICAALCQTAAYFIAKYSAEKIPAVKLVGYGQLIGGGILFIFSYIFGGKIASVNSSGILCMIVLIIISSAAYVLSLMPLKYFPASEISSFNLLITVFGVVMSGIILGENIFKLNYAASLALICAGILFVNGRTHYDR